jgi:hypothetical protein
MKIQFYGLDIPEAYIVIDLKYNLKFGRYYYHRFKVKTFKIVYN